MRIALLNTPYVKTYGPLKSASGRYFPLGLGYIAAVLRQHGHEVLLLDPEAQNLSDHAISSRLISFRPGLIGISFTTPGFPMARHLAALARNSSRGIPIVAGGVHAAALPEGVLREAPEFDIVCTGEGEETMLELAATGSPEALTPSALRSIPGVAFRAGERIEISPRRAWIKDLDSLPFPARELVDFDAYVPHAHNRRGRRVATAVTSRGCPYHCVFCASHVVLGRQFRSHSPEYIVSEIEYLVKTFGVDQIIFNDDVFTMDQARDRRICELILKRDLKISWFCFARVDSISKDILATMRKAGCFSVGFGVESGDPDMLKSMRKNITVERARQAVAWADELGLKSQCFFVLGCPGETEKSAERTIRSPRRNRR